MNNLKHLSLQILKPALCYNYELSNASWTFHQCVIEWALVPVLLLTKSELIPEFCMKIDEKNRSSSDIPFG